MSALLTRLLALIQDELPRAVELRHRLHGAPELAYEEHQTARAVSEALGIEAEPTARTGLISRIGRGRRVMVRAELDGLPIAEKTEVPYRSRNGAMHACAHDVHAAALVALARAASRIEHDLPAQLAVLFQPSEETFPSGAELIVRESRNEDRPHAVVAAHAHPDVAWGSLAIDAGPVNASTDNVEITVEGAGAHAAYPHKARDPVLALAQIVVALHAALGRRFDPLTPVVLTVGELSAGSAQNIIPAQARARATLRALQPDDRVELRAMVGEVTEATAQAHGCEGRVELVAGEPALENDPAIVTVARDLSAGAGLQIAPAWRSCGSDDFSFYSEIAPIAMGFVGLRGAPGFDQQPLHHPQFLPPDDAVGAVARAQAILYLAAADAVTRADAR